jgi:hypothetical protein
VWIRTLKGEEEEKEKNNQMMKKEEEKKKQEAKKILNNFPFRLGTHNCRVRTSKKKKK